LESDVISTEKETSDKQRSSSEIMTPSAKEILEANRRMSEILGPSVREMMSLQRRMSEMLGPSVREMMGSQRRLSKILTPAATDMLDSQRRISEMLGPSTRAMLDSQTKLSEMLGPSTRAMLDSQTKLSEMLGPSARAMLDSQTKLSEMLGPSVREMMGSQRRLSEILTPAATDMLDSQRRISEMLGPSVRSMLDSQRRISNLISKELVFDNWAKTNAQLFDHIKRRIATANRIDSEILPTLENYNWFLTVSLEDSFISDLSRIIENSSDKLPVAIRHEFISYFSRNNYDNLTSMIKSWEENSLFKPRMKIFKDSFNLLKHSHNSYNPANVLIPTLIAQIDGILTDYLIQNEFTIEKEGRGLVWKDKTNKPLHKVSMRNKIYEKIFDQNVNEYTLANSSMSTTALGIGNEFILNTLFQTAFTKQKLKKPFGLSRHKIMHGEYVRYGRKEHLIRTYLILDFLYGLENVDHNNTSQATN
jgi:hypothetical protein